MSVQTTALTHKSLLFITVGEDVKKTDTVCKY